GTLTYGRARYRDVGKKRGKQRLPTAEHIVVENGAPAIVTRELWDAAQARHHGRRFGAGRPWHRPYLLSGLIECAHCGKRFQAKKLARTRTPACYICGGYVASGAQFCNSPRIPTTYLDDAVLEGIQKRLDIVLDAAELGRRVDELLDEDRHAASATVPELESRLTETRQGIGRLVTALAAGTDDLRSVRAALVELERHREGIETDLAEAFKRVNARGEPRADVVATTIESLGSVRDLLASGSSEERKSIVRSFLQGIRIDAARRQV